MSNRKLGVPPSSHIRSRSLRAIFKAAETVDGDRGMADLKPHLGAFSGGPMPSLLSKDYLVFFLNAQRWACAAARIDQGSVSEKDRLDVQYCMKTFKLWGLDPRDFGFGNLTEFDVEVALARGELYNYEKNQ